MIIKTAVFSVKLKIWLFIINYCKKISTDLFKLQLR